MLRFIYNTTYSAFLSILTILLLAMVILASSISISGFVRAKQELSAAKRYYTSKMDNANSSEILSAQNQIKKDFPRFNMFFFSASPIEVKEIKDTDYANSSQKKSDTGYYGRPLTIRFTRQVKFFFNKEPFEISVGSATVNRTTMDPTSNKSIEYRLGKEYE